MFTLGEFIAITISTITFLCRVVLTMFWSLPLFAFINYFVERKRNGINRDAY